MNSNIPASVIAFALKHRISVGRDDSGMYYVRDIGGGALCPRYCTASNNPTAANAIAMMRRYIKDNTAEVPDVLLYGFARDYARALCGSENIQPVTRRRVFTPRGLQAIVLAFADDSICSYPL